MWRNLFVRGFGPVVWQITDDDDDDDYVLCSRFLPNTLIIFLSSFVIPSKCLKKFIYAASKCCSSLSFSAQASLPNSNAALPVTL